MAGRDLQEFCCNCRLFINQLLCQEFFGFEHFELLVAHIKGVKRYIIMELEQGSCPEGSGFDLDAGARTVAFRPFIH